MLVVGKLRRRATTKTQSPGSLCWSEPEAISVITDQSLLFTTYLETKSACPCECVILWVWFCFKWNKCTFFYHLVFNNSLLFLLSVCVLHVHYITRVDTVCIVIYWGLRKICFLSSSFLFSIINTNFAVFQVLLCCTHSKYYFIFLHRSSVYIIESIYHLWPINNYI